MSKSIKYLSPAFIWLLIIVFLSTKGGISMPSFNLIQMDKLAHAAAYGLLVGLSLWGMARMNGTGRVYMAQGLSVFLFASAFGALMEVVQYKFFPDRFFEYDDMLANCIGAAIGWFIFVRFFQTTRKS